MLEANKAMIVTSSDDPASLFKILDGEQIGTLFKGLDA